MSEVVTEERFSAALTAALDKLHRSGSTFGSVTGPGRSGAVAAVYASHKEGVPFIPFGQPCPDNLRPLLIIDTAAKSGRTLRKAGARYGHSGPVHTLAVFCEPPRVRFWYEAS